MEEEMKKKKEDEEEKKEGEMTESVKRKKKGPISLQLGSSSTIEENEDKTAVNIVKDEQKGWQKRKYRNEWKVGLCVLFSFCKSERIMRF